MIVAGIDAGSRTIKVVLMNHDDLSVVGSGLADQGVKQDELATQLLESVLKKAGLNRRDVERMVATGYGRDSIDEADSTVTEITCHACGVHHLMPEARTVIDIGGQDSKILHLEPDGRVRDFTINDRCAAGTGRFLEVVAARLGLTLEDLGQTAHSAKKSATINSTCAVFAETEIIGLMATGTRPEDIAAGVQSSIASRVASMAGHRITEPVVFTGGVALIPGMDKMLELALGHPVVIVPRPQMSGALGAALIACGLEAEVTPKRSHTP